MQQKHAHSIYQLARTGELLNPEKPHTRILLFFIAQAAAAHNGRFLHSSISGE